MQEITYPSPEPIYYVAYDNAETVCHYGKVNGDQIVSTGLANLQQFAEADVLDWVSRVAEFGTTLILEDGTWIKEE